MTSRLDAYKQKIAVLSEQLVDIQRPIRILDAIKWSPAIDQKLRKSGFREMPAVDANYYASNPLGFDPDQKFQEFDEFTSLVKRELGQHDDIGQILLTSAREYKAVIEMLLARGTPEFWAKSRSLYGSPKDGFFDNTTTIRSLGELIYPMLTALDRQVPDTEPMDLDAHTVVDELNGRFLDYFGPNATVHARIADEIWADAAAGGDTVKIRQGARFSRRDVDILEVHEGWVHLGTTQNGLQQSCARWLSKGPPRCSATQEGLAIIMEIFTFRSYAKRARHINDRILAIDRAEDGASILDIIEFFRTEGYSEDDCLANAKRVFRGGVVEGGAPFTKDIAYCKGYVENYNFIRAAVRAGHPELIPFLFTGKLHIDDIPVLYRKHKEGIVDAPRYLPPQFQDVSGVAVWMSFSNFLNRVNLPRIQEHYDRLFETYL
ncbi:MAG: hypothetical protein A2X94_14975 [Bdellovibrionales bacterium GWB1_55_8]|nr:MAG: hypothetical protein A2X94_14975 [Bdellovibrionales bacterium GWB1_55_8]